MRRRKILTGENLGLAMGGGEAANEGGDARYRPLIEEETKEGEESAVSTAAATAAPSRFYGSDSGVVSNTCRVRELYTSNIGMRSWRRR